MLRAFSLLEPRRLGAGVNQRELFKPPRSARDVSRVGCDFPVAVTAAFGVFLSSWSWRWRAHGTGDQLCEMENREPRMVDLKQMGLPTSFTRAAAAAYLNVLAWKATAYERRI